MNPTVQNKSPNFERRPWGSFTVLDELANFKVKRVEILPQKRLSYQKHEHRSEHWLIVQECAKVTLNEKIYELKIDSTINIAVSDNHRIENQHGSENLIFIEIQQGDYLGEDDIIRFEDDFNRVEVNSQSAKKTPFTII